MKSLTLLIIASTVIFSQQKAAKKESKKLEEHVKVDKDAKQAEIEAVHQAAIKFFAGVPEDVIKEMHSVFTNEKSTVDEMEAILKKIAGAMMPSKQKERFQEILSQLKSLITLRIKLFNEASDKAKEAIRKIDRSKMDQMLAFAKLDEKTRKEVMAYYIKIKKAQRELLAKVHRIHTEASKSKEEQNPEVKVKEPKVEKEVKKSEKNEKADEKTDEE